MKASDLISRTVPKPVTKGRNLDQVGWCDGYLLVRFKGRGTLYIYGPAIDEDTVERLLKVPYPDKLFTQWRDKGGWQCHKVAARGN
jgi:hypothetical protein